MLNDTLFNHYIQNLNCTNSLFLLLFSLLALPFLYQYYHELENLQPFEHMTMELELVFEKET
jgi:hypothetical protein